MKDKTGKEISPISDELIWPDKAGKVFPPMTDAVIKAHIEMMEYISEAYTELHNGNYISCNESDAIHNIVWCSNEMIRYIKEHKQAKDEFAERMKIERDNFRRDVLDRVNNYSPSWEEDKE